MNIFFSRLKEKQTLLGMAAVLILSAALFFTSLGNHDLSEREAREALAVHEMVNHGDFFLPKINGDTLRTKPPLFHWMACLFAKIRGEVDEYAARLPSAVCATGGVIAIFLFGTYMFGGGAGTLSALILATNAKYLEMANMARVDMVLTFFVSLAYVFFYLAYKKEGRAYFTLFFVSLGLAALAKGPVGVICALISIFSFLALRKRMDVAREMNFSIGFFMIFGFLSLWLLPALYLGKDELLDTIYQETIARFIGTTTHQAHIEPFYYYLPQLFGGFAPWSIFLPASLILYFRETKKDEALLYVFLWFASIFLFLSLSAGKRGDYLLPLYPAAALMTGKLLWDFMEGEKKFNFKLSLTLSSIPVLLTGVLLLVISISYIFMSYIFFSEAPFTLLVLPILTKEDQSAAKHLLENYGSWLPFLSALFFVLGLLGLGHFWAIRRGWARVYVVSIFIMVLLISGAGALAMAEINRLVSWKPFMSKVREKVSPEDKLAFFGKLRLKMVFYSGRHIPLVSDNSLRRYFDGQRPAYLIAQEEAVEGIRKISRSPVHVAASYKNFRDGFVLLSNPP